MWYVYLVQFRPEAILVAVLVAVVLSVVVILLISVFACLVAGSDADDMAEEAYKNSRRS